MSIWYIWRRARAPRHAYSVYIVRAPRNFEASAAAEAAGECVISASFDRGDHLHACTAHARTRVRS
jgi:hypothetical protein